MSIRVLIVDDQALVRAGFRMILDGDPDIEVVGEAADGEQAVHSTARLEPDVVLMDIRMPQLDGLACLDLIRQRHPDVKVVVLSAYSDRDHIESALRRGASAYIVKSSFDQSNLLDAVRRLI